MLLAALTVVSNLIYVFFSHLVFILSAVIIANVGAGGWGGGQGGGPFNPVEQALLAEKCTPENRNRIFSTNTFVGSLMGSLGALLSGSPQYLQESWGWQSVVSYKPLFALTILFSVILIFAYSTISQSDRNGTLMPSGRASINILLSTTLDYSATPGFLLSLSRAPGKRVARSTGQRENAVSGNAWEVYRAMSPGGSKATHTFNA